MLTFMHLFRPHTRRIILLKRWNDNGQPNKHSTWICLWCRVVLRTCCVKSLPCITYNISKKLRWNLSFLEIDYRTELSSLNYRLYFIFFFDFDLCLRVQKKILFSLNRIERSKNDATVNDSEHVTMYCISVFGYL